jgi:ribosomal protein S18 acetylase RimI-like enzyme
MAIAQNNTSGAILASIAALQAYQRKAAAHTRQVHACGPFHLYIHPTDSFRFFNYAIPDEPIESLTAEQLATLKSAFAAQGRTLRFEFLHEYTPRLSALLDSLGVPCEGENPLLVCVPQTWLPAAGPEGLEIRRLMPASPDADLAAYLSVGNRGFGGEGHVSPARVQELRQRVEQGSADYLALLDGQPAGVGAYMIPLDGFTELAGIATLPEYRRLGIAGALTAEMARAAFEDGVHTSFLTAADDDASRVYQRAGFRRIGTGMAYGDGG